MLKFAFGLVVGLAIGGAFAAAAEVRARVNTNGTLFGYIVQKDGEEVCRNPQVFNRFRGTDSYIICD